MLKISSNIPLPPPSVPRGKYPWKLMKVGDSFFLPKSKGNLPNVSAQGIRQNRRYSYRAVVEQGEKGIRIWRVK